jgi:hypothetical protein
MGTVQELVEQKHASSSSREERQLAPFHQADRPIIKTLARLARVSDSCRPPLLRGNRRFNLDEIGPIGDVQYLVEARDEVGVYSELVGARSARLARRRDLEQVSVGVTDVDRETGPAAISRGR